MCSGGKSGISPDLRADMIKRALRLISAGLAALFVCGHANAAVTTFPASVFSVGGGATGTANLVGSTPATANFNRNQSVVLNFGTDITNNTLVFNIASVAPATTYVWVRFGQITGGSFTNAPGTGLLTPTGGGTQNYYAQVTGPGLLSVPGTAFVASCQTIGGCNAVVFGASSFSAFGGGFSASSLVASNPEPGAWALMIIAFAGVAARLKSMRGRQRVSMVAA